MALGLTWSPMFFGCGLISLGLALTVVAALSTLNPWLLSAIVLSLSFGVAALRYGAP